jgi:hypothetical protein
MKNPEYKGRSRTGKIVDIKPACELGMDTQTPIAIIKGRQQVLGDRRIRDTWYPLFSAEEQKLAIGQEVIITRRTEKVGLGSITTSTIRPR